MAKVLKTKNVVAGVHYTTEHTGKMAGLWGVSTSVTLNPICQRRIKDGESVCSHCFSQRMWNPQNGIYRKQRACYEENFRILTTHLLEGEELPEFDPVKVPLVRIESFGDVATVIQARNYLRMAKRNPKSRFAAWTKNPAIWAQAIPVEGKPENLQMVPSSFHLNRPDTGIAEEFGFFDKVFTVYDKTAAGSVDINCGARSCKTCQRCYRKNPKGVALLEVNEKLK